MISLFLTSPYLFSIAEGEDSGGENSISEDEQSESQSDFPDNEESQHDDVFDDEDENVLNVLRKTKTPKIFIGF